jgi:hypothetical protein
MVGVGVVGFQIDFGHPRISCFLQSFFHRFVIGQIPIVRLNNEYRASFQVLRRSPSNSISRR